VVYQQGDVILRNVNKISANAKPAELENLPEMEVPSFSWRRVRHSFC
jgi:hypothetical protein